MVQVETEKGSRRMRMYFMVKGCSLGGLWKGKG